MPTLEGLGIDRLTTAEQLTLAQDVLDRVAAAQPRPPLSDAKRHELDRRSADADDNPADVVTWEQVEAAALARFAK
jgi:putative addiction module component (TIGR02574 family)